MTMPVDPLNDRAKQPERRRFLSISSAAAMAAGLLGGYGALAGVAARFLYPAGPPAMLRLLIGRVSEISHGQTLAYLTPDGRPVNVTRQGDAGGAADFVALSSTCPHLGCQVHWEPQNDRFFCPCHNGTFDAGGKGTGGPPGEAGLSLPRYSLFNEGDLLFIEVPAPVMTLERALAR